MKDHAARLKCATVGFIPPGQTTVVATTSYQGAKFPKVGSGSYLESSGTPGTANTSTAVVIDSGAYIVSVRTFGADPITVKDLQTIAARAVKRLPVPTAIPATTTTAAPK